MLDLLKLLSGLLVGLLARASLSATHEVSSNVVRADASRGPIARIRFPPPATNTNRITATDRVPADEQLGKPGISVDRRKRR